eukprot:3781427-Prymnesium_polylepis.1
MLHGLARKSKIGKRLSTANEQNLGLSADSTAAIRASMARAAVRALVGTTVGTTVRDFAIQFRPTIQKSGTWMGVRFLSSEVTSGLTS